MTSRTGSLFSMLRTQLFTLLMFCATDTRVRKAHRSSRASHETDLLEGPGGQARKALSGSRTLRRDGRIVVARQQVPLLEQLSLAQLLLDFAEYRDKVDSRFAGTANRLVRKPDLRRNRRCRSQRLRSLMTARYSRCLRAFDAPSSRSRGGHLLARRPSSTARLVFRRRSTRLEQTYRARASLDVARAGYGVQRGRLWRVRLCSAMTEQKSSMELVGDERARLYVATSRAVRVVCGYCAPSERLWQERLASWRTRRSELSATSTRRRKLPHDRSLLWNWHDGYGTANCTRLIRSELGCPLSAALLPRAEPPLESPAATRRQFWTGATKAAPSLRSRCSRPLFAAHPRGVLEIRVR